MYMAFQSVHRPLQVKVDKHALSRQILRISTHQSVPHIYKPRKAPSKYTRRYDNTGMTNPQKIFAGMVTALDDAIGQVVDGLKESGLWDNTLIFFSNDNGREGAEQHRGGLKKGHF